MTERWVADSYDQVLLAEVRGELDAQIGKWGVQRHPDGTDPFKPMSYIGLASVIRDQARDSCDRAAQDGRVTWRHIAAEELFETLAEPAGSVELRAELIQLAAVCVSWVRDLDLRRDEAQAESGPSS
jgi:hypothetical protein